MKKLLILLALSGCASGDPVNECKNRYAKEFNTTSEMIDARSVFIAKAGQSEVEKYKKENPEEFMVAIGSIGCYYAE